MIRTNYIPAILFAGCLLLLSVSIIQVQNVWANQANIVNSPTGNSIKNDFYKQKKHSKKYQKFIKKIHSKYTKKADQMALHDYVTFQAGLDKRLASMRKLLSKETGVNYSVKINKYSNHFFAKSDRLYIFISSSIPIQTLRDYAEIVSVLKNNNIYFVLRGCVDGCHTIAPTESFVKKMIGLPDNKVLPIAHGIQIDPLLFRLYGIKRVPVFVYAENVNPLNSTRSQGWLKNLSGKPVFYKSIGDWSFRYHIEQLANASKSNGLKELLDNIDKTWYQK